ncbi:hypothetical protein PS2_009181 [Malus domestica]
MELDMDEGDSKKRKDVALHGVEECEGVKGPCEQNSNDDLALFLKQFKRVFRNRENGGKWFVSLQPIMRTIILKRITKVMLEKETGTCQMCLGLALRGGNGHRAVECANTKSIGQNREKAMMTTWSVSNDQESVLTNKSSDDKDSVVAFVAPVEEVSSSEIIDVHDAVRKLSYQELSNKYETLFDETCIALLENVELTC